MGPHPLYKGSHSAYPFHYSRAFFSLLPVHCMRWCRYWGEGGFFRMQRGTNECGVEGQVGLISPGATWHKKSAAAP